MSNYAEFTFRIFSTPLVNINASAVIEGDLTGFISIYPSRGDMLLKMLHQLNIREVLLSGPKRDPLDYWYGADCLVICGYDNCRYVFVGDRKYLKLLEHILISYVRRVSVINTICNTCKFDIINTKTVVYNAELFGRESNSLINYFMIPAYKLARVERFSVRFFEHYYHTVLKKIPIFERKLVSAALELVV